MKGDRLNTLTHLEEFGREEPSKEKYGWTQFWGWGSQKEDKPGSAENRRIAWNCAVETYQYIKENRELEAECNRFLDIVDKVMDQHEFPGKEELWDKLTDNLIEEYKQKLHKL